MGKKYGLKVFNPFSNTAGKEKIACNEQILLFQGIFYHYGESSANFIEFGNTFCKFLIWKSLKYVFWDGLKTYF